MKFDDDDAEPDIWTLRIQRYRTEEPIPTVLDAVTKPRFVFDKTIETELKGYFIFIQKTEQKPRGIRGPGDLETALHIFEEIQTVKDRVGEILLTYRRIQDDLERLWDTARVYILTKPEVANAKSESVRLSIVSRTVAEVEDALALAKSYVTASELLTRNLNKSYDILASQVDTIKQMMYWRSLSLPGAGDKPTSLKFG